MNKSAQFFAVMNTSIQPNNSLPLLYIFTKDIEMMILGTFMV